MRLWAFHANLVREFEECIEAICEWTCSMKLPPGSCKSPSTSMARICWIEDSLGSAPTLEPYTSGRRDHQLGFADVV